MRSCGFCGRAGIGVLSPSSPVTIPRRRARSSASRVRPVALAALAIAAVAIASTGALERSARADESVKIYVAASTKDAVDEIVRSFRAATGIEVEVSPGASSKLAKQIVEGGPADLFLSADQANANELEKRGLVAERRNLLVNRLVVVVPAASTANIKSLNDLAAPAIARVALAIEPVPAGVYAREALRKVGVWQSVEAKVVGGEDVRATLAFVEQGADAGIVYLTDAAASSKVRVALEVDPKLHAPIEYPLVLTTSGAKRDGARRLYERLSSDDAAAVFQKARFQVMR